MFIDMQPSFFSAVGALQRVESSSLTAYLEAAVACRPSLVFSDDSSVIVTILAVLPLRGSESLIVE